MARTINESSPGYAEWFAQMRKARNGLKGGDRTAAMNWDYDEVTTIRLAAFQYAPDADPSMTYKEVINISRLLQRGV